MGHGIATLHGPSQRVSFFQPPNMLGDAHRAEGGVFPPGIMADPVTTGHQHFCQGHAHESAGAGDQDRARFPAHQSFPCARATMAQAVAVDEIHWSLPCGNPVSKYFWNGFEREATCQDPSGFCEASR